MERSQILKKQVDKKGRTICAAGYFQPGDATRYLFTAVALPKRGNARYYAIGGSLMRTYEFDEASIWACYRANIDAVGNGGSPLYSETVETDSYISYVASKVNPYERDGGAKYYTAWAMIQWAAENVVKHERVRT